MSSRGRDLVSPSATYRGAAGQTRTRAIHVTLPGGELASATVYEAVDARANPELAERLRRGELNRVHTADGEVAIATPVVFHDPEAGIYAVVAAEGDRHRELELRAAAFAELARDPAVAVPRYVRDLAVVFGPAELAALLDERIAGPARRREAAAQLERDAAALTERRAALAEREASLDRRARELEARQADLEAAGAEAARRLVEADRDATRLRAEAERDAARIRLDAEREAARIRDERRAPAPTPAPEPVTTPVAALAEPRPEEATSPFELLSEADAPALPTSADPVTTVTADAPRPGADGWLAGFVRGSAPAAFTLDGDRARVALRASGASGAALATSPLDVRLLVHRLPEYGVLVLLLGTPAALRGVGPAHRAMVPLDVAADLDRRFLAQLEREFVLEVDVVVDGRPARRARLKAPLSENVGYAVRAASDHVRPLGASASFARGLVALGSAGTDLLGGSHPEHAEFRVDKLEPLATANQVRRALAIARRFSKPAREDYLVCVRGFPLPRWRELRHAVLARAVEFGLWMGPELAQAAVSEGLARSRKDLVVKLEAGFAALLGRADANDLDTDAIDDNRQALAVEASALGIAPQSAEAEPQVSGMISAKPPSAASLRQLGVAELLRLLDDRERRLAAALELCERGEGAAVRAIMNAVRRMSRGDAVRVLGAMVRLGPAAAPTLTAGLASSKAFLRHGCALALALLRTEAGTEAVVDALLGEPTEIWREIARAVGHVGPPALMPLAARLGRLGDRATASDRERIAWAMAHVGVRGGKAAVATLAAGQSAVAPVARMALERIEPAASDDISARAPAREVTVNRAFSRRFFEALERGLPELGKGELAALDISQPMELLDDDDLLVDPEDERAAEPESEAGSDLDAELDESDLVDD
jgi:hypothetical protein